ncbi:enoyl-CoA hydratase/isomerase family protein [Nocardia sp. CA-135398]|uniref:enoyl-CoA hydratase/isomerase family protein n=1 Tax=Nocardia sp. CA-135398 TaxID=3239977 RepID=UPI003D99332D
MTTVSVVASSTEGGVSTVRLCRPRSLNSLNLEAKTQLLTALNTAGGDPNVRAVVITGTGKAFCVGQDLNEMQSGEQSVSPGDAVREHYIPIIRAITTMPKPVIAAINGTAAGAGLSLALAADIRIAADSARFTTAFAGIGLACDTGISWTLPRVIGHAAALDLLLRPRLIPAADALRLGLVHQVVNDEDFSDIVRDTAAEFAAGPTVALASIKAAVNRAATSTLDDALEFEATQITLTSASLDHKIGVEALLAKSKPQFTGR